MTARTFHLGDILSVTTGVLVSQEGIGGVYNILNFLTGDNLFTHQLPRAADACAPHLLRLHPDLAAIEPPVFDGPAEALAWLDEQTGQHGTHRKVTPLSPGVWVPGNPITDLQAMGSAVVAVLDGDQR